VLGIGKLINLGKYPILGVQISAVDYSYAVASIIEAAQKGIPLAVTALAVHGVMTGALNPMHRRRLNGIDLTVPDGQPVRWGMRWVHGIALPDRVYGPELTLRVLEAAAKEGLGVYFYGSTEETLRLLIQNIKRAFPELDVAGSEPSRFRQISKGEKSEVIARIKASGTRLVFVGLGCPRQEVWVCEYLHALRLPLLAVGAAFAFHAGILPQAPGWMQNAGLEWLYRLVQEPTRLWKRYVVLNPIYLGLVLLETFGIVKVPVLFPNGMEREESYG
jgi:N-acetylglucosaminyldiphosphoundecaprenol N-acetyl-beta-D-mannosaminyltransferase